MVLQFVRGPLGKVSSKFHVCETGFMQKAFNAFDHGKRILMAHQAIRPTKKGEESEYTSLYSGASLSSPARITGPSFPG